MKLLIIITTFIYSFCSASLINSQPSFTKINDPNNPAVTDAFESTGACWADFNNDGYLDLFVSNGNITNQNNSLYLNNQTGGFIKIITGPVVNDGGSSIGGTCGDYNNDGFLDLFVTNRNNFGNFLYLGTGDSIFTKITAGNIVTDLFNSNSSNWIDLNKDGLLDLHVVNFTANDILYMNNGMPDFTFTKIDTSAFLLDGTGTFSIVGGWSDYNNDRLTDFFIGTGGTQNDFVFTNNGNQVFTKTILNDARNSLGCSWGDFDNDGDLDLFTAGFLNSKSRLYRNSGPPSFNLEPIDTGIVSNDPSNSIGSCWGDFDNDGDLDLFVSNDGSNNFLYTNTGAPNYGFIKITAGAVVNDGGNSFGCAAGDYNNDGQLDIYIPNRLNQQNFLYRNNGNNNNWITIKCSGISSNFSAIGTKVRIKSGNTWQMQEVTAQTGYNSQNLLLHFGLGNASLIDSIKVEWINGLTHSFVNQTSNRNITISESGTIIGISQTNHSVPGNFELQQNFPNPFNPATQINYKLSEGVNVKISIYNTAGQLINELFNGVQKAGEYQITWNAKNKYGGELPSGIYFLALTAGNNLKTIKMNYIK